MPAPPVIPSELSGQPIAFLDGRYQSADTTRLSVWDHGFTMGVTVTERMRTFGGRLEFLERHLARLERGLEIVGLSPQYSLEDFSTIAQRLVEHNYRLIPKGSDLGVGFAVTPGGSFSGAAATEAQTTDFIFTCEIPFASWVNAYRDGLSLTSVSIRETPASVLPKELKCRSRMHYYLAEKEAREKAPGSRALLLDLDGNIAEATIASVAMVKGTSLIAPPESDVLPSISFGVSAEMLTNTGMKIERRKIALNELAAADEVLWFNSTTCVVPVTNVNGISIGNGRPGPTFQKLRTGWLFVAKADFVAQANQFALLDGRSERE